MATSQPGGTFRPGRAKQQQQRRSSMERDDVVGVYISRGTRGTACIARVPMMQPSSRKRQLRRQPEQRAASSERWDSNKQRDGAGMAKGQAAWSVRRVA
jgi:hypothetical protein